MCVDEFKKNSSKSDAEGAVAQNTIYTIEERVKELEEKLTHSENLFQYTMILITFPILLSSLTVVGSLLTVVINRNASASCAKIFAGFTIFFGFLMVCSICWIWLLLLI